jgi:hypothetical protein
VDTPPIIRDKPLLDFLLINFNPLSSKTSSFIKDSFDFIQKTQNLHLDDNDIMVNFDVVSLFTKIHVLEALTLISKLVDSETLNLIEICLTSTFFTFKGFSMNKLKVQPWDLPYPQ